MASRREYEMLFKMNAELNSSFNGTFNKAQKEIATLQKDIDALNKTQSDISAYQKQEGAIEATNKKLEMLRQQYDNIQKEISETEGYSASLENQLLSKQQQIDKTSISLEQQTQKLERMSSALNGAGINTSNLAGESARLGTQIEEVKRQQEETAEASGSFGASASAAISAVSQALIAAGIAKALKEIYDFFMDCAEASMEFESVMTGVAKTTDFTDSELRNMSGAIKEMTTIIPILAEELGGITEDAGQLGVAKESLLDFTEIMAMLGTATNMTSREAATMLAQLTSITGMNPALYSNLGSAIVALGNSFATTEKNIADMSQTIAAAGSIAGMSEADIVAISAAVTSLGISAQNGGTQMTKLISEINSAVSSGEDLESWASVANMSADEFANAWGNNAAGGLDLFIRGLNDVYKSGGDVYGVLSDLGITETRMVTMMTSLAKSGDRLTNTLNVSNVAWSENSALTAEAEKRYATTQSQLTLMQNAYDNLRVAIGDAYTPTLREAYGVGADVLNSMAKFVQENPELVRAVTAAVAVFGTVGVALAAYTAAAKIATIASAALSAAIPGVNVIMAVTAAVAILTAGVVALTGATDEEAEEVRNLTEASREQYYQIQDLTREYEYAASVYGETSDEARQLRWQIEDLTDEYEHSKQTVEQFSKEIEATVQANAELINSYRDANEEIDKQEYNVAALINRLSALVSQNDMTSASQEQIKATVDALNQALPELNLNYEDVIAKGSDFIESIKSMAQAEATRQRYQESYAAYVNLLGTATTLERDAAKALAEKESVQERYNQAYAAYQELLAIASADPTGMSIYGVAASQEAKEFEAAKASLDEYTKSYEDATAAHEENVRAQEEALAIMNEYVGVEGEATEGNKALQAALSETKLKIDDLVAAYNAAYEAALDSVQGQYSIWEEAAEVVATSAGAINAALESQVTYWQDYNSNLAGLTDRTSEIEGLAEVIASFADGSSDSVNAVAGMAAATDDELAAMVANWKTLQEEQKSVAGYLADLETDFSASMETIQENLTATVAAMNLGDEAAQSGIDTIQGYIDGVEGMLPAVADAYTKLAKAASSAISGFSPEITPGWGRITNVGIIDGSHAQGLDYVPYDGYIAELHKGERVLTAEEAEQMQIVAMAPQFMAALGAHSAVSAESGGSGYGMQSVQVAVNFSFEGGVSADAADDLRVYGDEFAERVREVIEDINGDNDRRRYR